MSNDGSPRRLVDMATYPEDPIYEPPPKSACDALVAHIDITDALKLTTSTYEYKGRIVRFALMLYFAEGDEMPKQVSRIDTCHGEVHRHIMRKGSEDDREVVLIRTIPVDETSWNVVDSEYSAAVDMMIREAEEFLRRWRP